jgi:hypothetical protein
VIIDRGKRKTLGEAAAKRAHREFTVSVMADRYEGLYAGALAARSRVALQA